MAKQKPNIFDSISQVTGAKREPSLIDEHVYRFQRAASGFLALKGDPSSTTDQLNRAAASVNSARAVLKRAQKSLGCDIRELVHRSPGQSPLDHIAHIVCLYTTDFIRVAGRDGQGNFYGEFSFRSPDHMLDALAAIQLHYGSAKSAQRDRNHYSHPFQIILC